MKPYRIAISKLAEAAPSLETPGKFIVWAEEIADLLSYIYEKNYDDVTEDLTEAAKDEQGWSEEDEDEDEDED